MLLFRRLLSLTLFLPLTLSLLLAFFLSLSLALSVSILGVAPISITVPLEIPSVVLALLLRRVLGLILLIDQFLHGLLVLLLEVLSDLLDDIVERRVLSLLLALLLVHVLDEFDERVFDLATGVREDHHDEVPHQWFSRVEILRGVVVDDGRIVELAEAAEIHGHLIVEPHQLRGLVKVLQVLVVIQDFDEALDQFAIGIHGVLIEAVVEVVGQFLVLRLSVGGIGEVVLVEGVLEDVLGLDDVHGPSSHRYL